MASEKGRLWMHMDAVIASLATTPKEEQELARLLYPRAKGWIKSAYAARKSEVLRQKRTP